MKSSNSAQVNQKGKISGPKTCGREKRSLKREERQTDKEECFEIDTNYAGFGIPNNKIEKIVSAEDCETECAIRVGCLFWTWNTGKSSRFPNTCWLKSNDAGRKPGVGKISGPRSCSSPSQTLDLGPLTNANNKGNDDTPIPFLNGKTLSLFDLAADPEERTNLAAEQSDLAQQLLARLLEHAATLLPATPEGSDRGRAEGELAPGWCKGDI